jgi:2-polyprenyl-3-methyl-5-hydroxy-6-metoxy-1,4-benzoquinol methylase
MGPLQRNFYALLNERFPMFSLGVAEARQVAPDLVDELFEETLGWVTASFGNDVLSDVASGYASFTMDVNRAQQNYELAGRYRFSTFAEADAAVYQSAEYMRQYYWGVFAILFGWPHYVELVDFYIGRFVPRLPAGRIIEIAPGHGTWGLLALSRSTDTTLEGWDVSPTSLEIAPRMAAGAGLSHRCLYRVADATQLQHQEAGFDAAVCSFMLEHLERPAQFLADFARSLRPGALAFVTLALTAGQTDHIYEFKDESEAILMAERAGFELIECRVSRPSRGLPNAKYVPRVQAVIVRKR